MPGYNSIMEQILGGIGGDVMGLQNLRGPGKALHGFLGDDNAPIPPEDSPGLTPMPPETRARIEAAITAPPDAPPWDNPGAFIPRSGQEAPVPSDRSTIPPDDPRLPPLPRVSEPDLPPYERPSMDFSPSTALPNGMSSRNVDFETADSQAARLLNPALARVMTPTDPGLAAYREASGNRDPYGPGGGLAATRFGTPEARMAQLQSAALADNNWTGPYDRHGNPTFNDGAYASAQNAMTEHLKNITQGAGQSGANAASLLHAQNILEAAKVHAQGQVDAARVSHENGPDSRENLVNRIRLRIQQENPRMPPQVVNERAQREAGPDTRPQRGGATTATPIDRVVPPFDPSNPETWDISRHTNYRAPTVPGAPTPLTPQRDLMERVLSEIRQNAGGSQPVIPGQRAGMAVPEQIANLVSRLQNHPQGGAPWIRNNITDLMDFIHSDIANDTDIPTWWNRRTSIMGEETPDELARRTLADAMRARLGDAAPRRVGWDFLGPLRNGLTQAYTPLPPNIVELLRNAQQGQ